MPIPAGPHGPQVMLCCLTCNQPTLLALSNRPDGGKSLQINSTSSAKLEPDPRVHNSYPQKSNDHVSVRQEKVSQEYGFVNTFFPWKQGEGARIEQEM